MNLPHSWPGKIIATAVFTVGIYSQMLPVLAQPAQVETPQTLAPVDMTGIWVSVITEDWRFRMLTAPVGDTSSMPINAEGQRVADIWDPQVDIAIGEECRAYGAAGIMRMPTRLRISWDNPNTLQIETDAGQQLRYLNFNDETSEMMEPSRQGYSSARWEGFREGQSQAAGGRGGGGNQLSGALEVITSQMIPGYLRKNGIPYSAETILEEHFDVIEAPNGDRWLVVLSKVIDPVYLNQPMWTSSHFKLESNSSNWNPTPCRVTLPTRDNPASTD
jgi:hypothetical protein